MPLYLSESDVEGLIAPAEAVPVIEECFRRMAAGAIQNKPRERLPHDDGFLAVLSAVDRELGYAGVKSYVVAAGRATFVVTLFDLATGELAAAIRAAVPSIEAVVAYCRTPERLEAFCRKTGAAPAEHASEAAAHDIVVTVTSSPDPVLRGEWLSDGALVCAVGANRPGARELDNVVLQRASFVCCDSRENAKLESSDLIEPVESGLLDWLEVHELQEVVAGEARGRQSEADIVVFKSNGLAAWDVAIGVAALERARERGVGREL